MCRRDIAAVLVSFANPMIAYALQHLYRTSGRERERARPMLHNRRHAPPDGALHLIIRRQVGHRLVKCVAHLMDVVRWDGARTWDRSASTRPRHSGNGPSTAKATSGINLRGWRFARQQRSADAHRATHSVALVVQAIQDQALAGERLSGARSCASARFIPTSRRSPDRFLPAFRPSSNCAASRLLDAPPLTMTGQRLPSRSAPGSAASGPRVRDIERSDRAVRGGRRRVGPRMPPSSSRNARWNLPPSIHSRTMRCPPASTTAMVTAAPAAALAVAASIIFLRPHREAPAVYDIHDGG